VSNKLITPNENQGGEGEEEKPPGSMESPKGNVIQYEIE